MPFQRRNNLNIVALSSKATRQEGQCGGANSIVVGNEDTQDVTTLVKRQAVALE